MANTASAMIRRGGRTAMLVGHDPKAVFFAREPQHGFQEVVAERPEHPGGAQNDMPLRHRAHPGLALRLSFTVDAKRRKAVGFDIGLGFGSVEDIIGRDMDDRCAGRRRDASDDPRPFCIDRRGHRRFALRFIDRCIGGRIEDEMWRHGRHRARDGGGVGDVSFATGDPDRLYSSISGGLQDFAAELPGGAENQNWPSHAT